MISASNIEEIINKEGFIVSDINGTSMSPFLNSSKHRVIITKLNRPINILDCVLYQTNNKYILHRVIGIDNDTLLIRGDNTLSIEKINKDNVLGILASYYDHNKCIDINDSINKKYYNISLITYPFRAIRSKIAKLVKY